MVGWHHQLNGHEFKQAPGAGDGPGGLACCSSWGRKELHMTEQMNQRRQWKIHGQRNLVGYSPWGREESDMTE